MGKQGGLAAYVTSHGFGHLNRTAAVLDLVPTDVPIVVRCHPDLFEHWRERLRRPLRLEPHVSDVGVLSPPGDSVATDAPATFAKAALVYEEAMGQVDTEAERLREEGTAAVLCDAPFVPIVAARRAGVPGFLLANFTWAEIYGPHARRLGGEAITLTRAIRDAYRQVSLVFRAEPALAMRHVGPTLDVGMVVAPGHDRRAELRQKIGLSRSNRDRLVSLYVGRYGQATLGWDALGRLPGIQFVSFHRPPVEVGSLPNLHVISPAEWSGADLAASVDAVVAKAGYGSVCEAMVAGTPLLYPPRSGFAEFRALDRALRAWGGGVPVPARDFASLRLGPHLERAFALRVGPPPFRADGAATVAERLASCCRKYVGPT